MTIDKETAVASPKKRKEIIRRLFGEKKKFPVVEIPRVPEIPIEIEKGQVTAGAATQPPQQVIDDQTGQVLAADPSAQPVKIVLPLSEDEIRYGLTQKLIESIRWLAEWCLRMIKKLGRRIPKKKKR